MSKENFLERRIDWHQTKGLSVTIIVLLLTNIISTVWWAATLTNDVDRIKDRPDLNERVIRLEAIQEANGQYLVRMATALSNMTETIKRIDREQARRASIVRSAEKHLEQQRK